MLRTKNESVVFTKEEFNEAVIYYSNREKIYQLAILVAMVGAFFIGLACN
jgi:hypothetical protein